MIDVEVEYDVAGTGGQGLYESQYVKLNEYTGPTNVSPSIKRGVLLPAQEIVWLDPSELRVNVMEVAVAVPVATVLILLISFLSLVMAI